MVAPGFNDPIYLVNLACLKHTGVTLPVNFNGSPEWSYTIELVGEELDGVREGKKKGKYNPYKSTLLRYPFLSISDSHPLEQKIKRAMIVSELNEAFSPDIKYSHITGSLVGDVNAIGVIPRWEINILTKIGGKILHTPVGERPLTHGHRYLYDMLIGDRINYTDEDDAVISGYLIDIIFYNKDRLPKTFKLLKDKLQPSPSKEKVKTITKKFWKKTKIVLINPTGTRSMGAHALKQGKTNIDRLLLNNRANRHNLRLISTNGDYPLTKRDTWLEFFSEYFHNKSWFIHTLAEIHDKRSNTKVNWWGEVKKQSGRYDYRATLLKKKGYENRLMTSILNQ